MERKLVSYNTVCRIAKTRGGIATFKTLKSLVYLLAILSLLSTTGCFGLAARHLMTGKDYSEMKTSMTPLSPGSARLFVYVLGGGPNVLDTLGLLDVCTVDEHIYRIGGDIYWYLDLVPGRHKLTVNGADITFGGGKYGKSVIEIDLEERETKYCRLKVEGFGVFSRLVPELIEESVAEHEMMKLSSHKSFKTGKTVKVKTEGSGTDKEQK
jgi:hypothetical protein